MPQPAELAGLRLVAEQMGGERETLEILGGKWCGFGGGAQFAVAAAPGLPLKRLAAALEGGGRSH